MRNNPALLGISRFLSVLFGLVTAPLLARSMDPSERGVVGAIIAFFSVLPILLDFGIAGEIRRRLLSSREFIAAKARVFALLTLPFAIAAGWYMSTFFFSGQSDSLRMIVFAGSVITPLLTLSAIDQAVLLNREDYGGVLVIRLTQPVVYLALIVGAFLSNSLTPEVAVIIVLIGNLFSGVVGVCLTRLPISFGIEVVTLIKAGSLFWLFGIGEFANARLDQVLSIVALSHEEAGYYMVVSIVFALPSSFIGASIGAHYYKRRSYFADTQKWVEEAVKTGIILGFWIIALLTLGAPFLLPLVFGDQYIPAIPSLLVGLAGSIFMVLYTIISQLAAAENKIVALASSAWAGLTVDILLLFALGSQGAVGAAIASSAGYLVALTVLTLFFKMNWKQVKLDRRDFEKAFGFVFKRGKDVATSVTTINFASFETRKFGKHNAQKLARAIWNLLISRALSILPLAKNKVLLDSFSGSVNGDSLSPIFEKLVSTNSQDELKVLMAGPKTKGERSFKYLSLRWLFHLVTARVLVVNSNLPYFFRKRKGQTLIQTWHGTPLKKMGFDLLERDFSNRSRKSLLRDSGYWDYLLVSSPFTEKVLIQAFKYKKVVVRSGLPRNDILFDPGNVREKIRESYGLKPHDRFVLYAPTWRDHASQGPSIQAFKELLESLPESDLVLGVRAHGWSSIAVDSKEYVGVLDLSLHPNISELYLAADILLTDFSSAMFDFSITGKPMAFLMPDLETYERTRGTYFGLERMGVGPVFKSGKNLAQKISRTDFDQFELARRRFVSKYAAFENGSATEQVVELIKMHLSS